jgi:catechol 2,3-dioxygenase-like lactoylglutathione lyase family enzyme
MAVEKLSFVLPVDDLAVAVAFWKDLLGMDPTFVDGDRWAQFDHGGARLALAGKDRASDSPGVMLKVRGLGPSVMPFVAPVVPFPRSPPALTSAER